MPLSSSSHVHDRKANLLRFSVAYVGVAGLCAATVFWLYATDSHIVSRSNAATAATRGLSHGATDTFLRVLVALLAISAASRVFGKLFSWLRQPAVIGEVVAGIALGPSILGHLSPAAASAVLPASVAPALSVLAQLGAVLYMFIVGLELDEGHSPHRAHATLLISHASIAIPFSLGVLLAVHLYPNPGFAGPGVSLVVFALFLGVSMSITAFPVLARILTDRGMTQTPLGTMALRCAAIDDMTAWCLLALVVSLAKTRPQEGLTTIALGVGYVGVMLFVVRPLFRRWVDRVLDRASGAAQISAAILLLLTSSAVSEWIGLHAIFGAFLAGSTIPSTSRVAQTLVDKLRDIVLILLLPAFFAFTGMRTQLGVLTSQAAWVACLLVIAVACAGKIGGSAFAARLSGMQWREAISLGVLMNTRGLMELVVLNIGLDLQVISPTMFTVGVAMAVVTTFMTTPLLDWQNARAKKAGALESSSPDSTKHRRPIELTAHSAPFERTL